MTFIMLMGYLIIAAVILNDVKRVVRRCRVELRLSHGKHVIYLRERRTGRLIGCGRNLFTLLVQGA